MHIRHARFHRKHFSNNGLFKKILFFFLSHSFLIFKAYHFTLFLLFHLPLHVWTYICHPFLMDIVLSFIFHPLPKTVPTKSYTLAYNHITDWKQILKKTSDKELLSKIYKEFLKFNNRKMSNVIFFKWAKDLNREVIQKYIQMANKYIERYSTSYVIKV